MRPLSFFKLVIFCCGKKQLFLLHRSFCLSRVLGFPVVGRLPKEGSDLQACIATHIKRWLCEMLHCYTAMGPISVIEPNPCLLKMGKRWFSTSLYIHVHLIFASCTCSFVFLSNVYKKTCTVSLYTIGHKLHFARVLIIFTL